MKMNQTAGTVESQELRDERQPTAAPFSSRHQPSTINYQPAFTLIELLVVISIIGVIAAFTIPALKAFKRIGMINQARAQMEQLATAIDSYKAVYGFYPPGNPRYPATNSQAMMSPLYFELLGTTNNAGTYYTLDGSASISANTTKDAYGVNGFINQMKPGAGEDAPAARNFIVGLKNNQFASATNNTVLATVFVTSLGGPDPNYTPFAPIAFGFNPWRYVCPGVNNPNSYDLWIQLSIGGKTNLICNWSRQVQFNIPLP